jgi:hypothetical protein
MKLICKRGHKRPSTELGSCKECKKLRDQKRDQSVSGLKDHYKRNMCWRNKHPKQYDRIRERSRLWKLYRLTLEDHIKILAFQEQHPVYKLLLGNKLGTDHCHTSGQIRGLLDWRLNRALGVFEKVSKDTPAILRAMADYLEDFPAEIALGKKVYGLIGKACSKKKPLYGPPPGHKE